MLDERLVDSIEAGGKKEMISYIVPTRNRPEILRETLRGIEALGDHARAGGAEGRVERRICERGLHGVQGATQRVMYALVFSWLWISYPKETPG